MQDASLLTKRCANCTTVWSRVLPLPTGHDLSFSWPCHLERNDRAVYSTQGLDRPCTLDPQYPDPNLALNSLVQGIAFCRTWG